MSSLIIKDFLLQKKWLLFSLGYFLFFCFVGIPEIAFTGTVVTVSFLFAISCSMYDDHNKTNIFINSLPVNRAKIVYARYASNISYILVISILFFITVKLLLLFSLPRELPIVSIEIMLITISVSILLISLYLPVVMKFGYIRSRFFNLILFLFIFGLAGFIGNSFVYSEKVKDWPIFQWAQSLTLMQFSILAIALSVLILLLSIRLSIYFYRKREFV